MTRSKTYGGTRRVRGERGRKVSAGLFALATVAGLLPLVDAVVSAPPAAAAPDPAIYIGVESGTSMLFFDTVTNQVEVVPGFAGDPFQVAATASGNIVNEVSSLDAGAGNSEIGQLALPSGAAGAYTEANTISTGPLFVNGVDTNASTTPDGVVGVGHNQGVDPISVQASPAAPTIPQDQGDPYTFIGAAAVSQSDLDPASTDTTGDYALIAPSGGGLQFARYLNGHFLNTTSAFASGSPTTNPTKIVDNGGAVVAPSSGDVAFSSISPPSISATSYDPSNHENYLNRLYIETSATLGTGNEVDTALPQVPGQVTGLVLAADQASFYVTSKSTSLTSDSNGYVSQISNCTCGGFSVGDVERSWITGPDPISPVFSGSSLFVADQGGDELTDINTTTGQLRQIPLGSNSPDSLAVSIADTAGTVTPLPVDEAVYVGNTSQESLVDYDTVALHATSVSGPWSDPPALVAGDGGNQILVGATGSSPLGVQDSVISMNTLTDQGGSDQVATNPPLASGAMTHLAYSSDGVSGVATDATGKGTTLAVDNPTAPGTISTHFSTSSSGTADVIDAVTTDDQPDVITGPNAQPGSYIYGVGTTAGGTLTWMRADPTTGGFYQGDNYNFQASFNLPTPITDGTDTTGLSVVGVAFDATNDESGTSSPANIVLTYDHNSGTGQGTYLAADTMFVNGTGQLRSNIKTALPAADVPQAMALSPDGCTLWVAATNPPGTLDHLFNLQLCLANGSGYGSSPVDQTLNDTNVVAMATDASSNLFLADATNDTLGELLHSGTAHSTTLPYVPTSLAIGETPAPSAGPASVSVSLQASASSTPAGIRSIALDNNGSLPSVSQQNSTSSTGSGLNTASPNQNVSTIKLGAIKLGAIKLGAIKLGAIKLGAIKLGAIALNGNSAQIHSLSTDLLSNINITYPDGCAGSTCQGWEGPPGTNTGLLAGSPLAAYPLQSLTLEQVLETDPTNSNPNSPASRFDSLSLSDIDVSNTSLGALPVSAFALGAAPISSVPLNSTDTTPTQILTTWCSDLASVNFPCSQFGVTPSNPSSAANVTMVSLGLAGVPLSSLPIASIPLNSTSVDAAPLGAIKLGAISIGDTGLDTVKLGAIKLGAIPLGAIKLGAIKLGAIKLGAIKLGAIKLGAIKLGAIKLGAISLQGTKLGAIKLGAIPLGAIKLGAIKLGAIKLGAIKLGAIPLSSILPSVLSQLVNCALVPCGTGTLNDALNDGALLSTADLQTLQSGITEPNPNWDQSTLADVDGTDTAGNPGADATTLLDLANLATATCGTDPTTYACQWGQAQLSDVGTTDNGTTLSDVENNLNAGTTDATTLADLLANETADTTTTLSQIIDEIAADDPSALNGLFLGDLLAGLVPESSYPWEDVNTATPGLAAASSDGGRVTLTATSTVVNGPQPLTYALTLPSGYSLISGSALFDGVAAPDPTLSGSTLNASPGTSNASSGIDTYSVVVAPNEVLGTQHAVEVASVPGFTSSAASATLNITDPFVGNTSPASASSLVSDTLNLSFLSSPTQSAYWDINVPAGDELSLDLSNLPADYDMVLYGPSTTELDNTAVQTTGGVTETPASEQSTSGQQDAPNQGDLPILTSNPVQAISSNRGTVAEQITTPELSGGNYLVQISGYNGAFSTTAPYALRAELLTTPASPACDVNPYPNPAGNPVNPGVPETLPPASAYTANTTTVHSVTTVVPVNTLFLVDPDRLEQAYGAGPAKTIMSDAATAAADTSANISGVLVPVEGDPTTASAYAAWDASPCSVAAANQVVTNIDATVRSIEAAHPTIQYIDIVGADDQIPMGRIPDQTVSDNESDYAAGTLPGLNDQLSAALSQGYFLSDDPYASPTPLGVGGQNLYTPSLAVGRLVESPSEIENALTRYVSSGGALNASSGLSTGYDFLNQGATAIATDLSNPRNVNQVASLIKNNFSASDLTSAIDGQSAADNGSVPDIQSINGHFDFGRTLSAAGDELPDTATDAQVNAEIVDTSQLLSATPGSSLAGKLLFSMGCHSGLNIPDNEIEAEVPGGVSTWAKTFADEGALWVANTGYGYANDQYIAYSAKLMGLFAGNLNGSLSIGDALAQAKQRYAADTGILDPYDMKASMESTFYGMPNYTLNKTGLTTPTGGASTPQLHLGTDPATGLQIDSVNLSVPLVSNDTTANSYGPINPPEGGTYYQVNGSTEEQVSTGFPIEPLLSQDVTDIGPGGTLAAVAHGALITGLTSTDLSTVNLNGNTTTFAPSFAQAESDLAANETPVPQLDTAFPATLQRVATFQLFDPTTGDPITHQEVNFISGQFIPNPANVTAGNQRLFTGINSSIEYASSSDTKFNPPTINESQGFIIGSGASQAADFNVLASPAPGGSAVKEVLVLFTDSTNPGTWQSVQLAQGADGSWTGGAAAPASGKISYIVQAVDGDGNVAMASNKGTDFNQVASTQSTGTGLTATASGATLNGGYYNGPVTLTVTGPAGSPITYQIDGGTPVSASSPVAIHVTGDGTHVITATDSQGDQTSQTVPIDTQAPVISSAVTSARTSANGYVSGGSSLNISAADAGSGVKTLTYQAGSGPVTPVTGPINVPNGGTTTYTVTATDFVGHSTTSSVVVHVDVTPPTVSCGSSDGKWHNTDQSVTCTGTDTQSGVAPPNPITLSTSVPAGTANANASTGSGTICDNVSNCSTVGPISGFMIDKVAPVVSCPAAGSSWHAGNATYTCTASDVGSGLASSSPIVLTATAPSGTATTTASTNTVSVCDVAGNCTTAGPITGVMVDNAPPTFSCPTADTKWHTGSVSFTCTVSDVGSGPIGNVTLTASIGAGATNANVSTGVGTACDKAGNCVTVPAIGGVMIDNAAPTVTCPSAGTSWHTGTVSYTCTASDAGSGLAQASQSSVVLTASAPANSSTTSASTNSVQICDALGNCATAGPITGVMIDNAAPVVSCPNADSNWHSGTVTITCTATDSGSGLASSAPITLTATAPPNTLNANATTNSVAVCDVAGNCSTAGPVSGIKIDNTAPVTSCPSADTKWHTGTVTIVCTGTDTGSGLAQTGGYFLSTSVPVGTANANASTNTVQACDNAGNCSTVGPVSGIMVDNAAPVASCPSADTKWHTGTQTFTCTVTDAGSGLANPSQSTVTLSASIPAGQGNGNVSTNSVSVCDNVGNCATVGPITNIMIDNSAPTVTIASPTLNQAMLLNQSATANYACADSGVTIASCTATVSGGAIANGAALPTGTVGTYTVKVTAVSASGNTTVASHSYTVSYNVCGFIGPIVPLGAVLADTVTICDVNGKSVGGGSVAMTAVNIDGSITPNGVLGNSFKWTPVLNVYVYSAVTIGLAKGAHTLNVSITGDPLLHALPFTIS